MSPSKKVFGHPINITRAYVAELFAPDHHPLVLVPHRTRIYGSRDGQVKTAQDIETPRQFYEGTYYSTLYKTVRAVGPHHLYLGSWTPPRLHPTDWPIMAANCDAIGLDFYSPTFLDSGGRRSFKARRSRCWWASTPSPPTTAACAASAWAVIKAKSRLQIRSPATSMRNGCRLRPPIPTWWESNGSNTWTSRLPGAATTMASRTSHPAWCSARMPRSEWWTAPTARSTTWPLNSETTLRAAPWMDFALLWKKPVVRLILSSSARVAVDIACGVGKRLNNSGVAMLTRTSVHWAERIVATRSSQGELWVRAQSTAG